MAVRKVEQLAQHYQSLKIFDECPDGEQISMFEPPKVRGREFPALQTAQNTISKSNLVFTRLHLQNPKGPRAAPTSTTTFSDN